MTESKGKFLKSGRHSDPYHVIGSEYQLRVNKLEIQQNLPVFISAG